MSRFRAGKVPILIVTDVAARGLDIPLLDNVINYDFPPQPKTFIHRAGRVARIGRLGKGLSFVTRDDMALLLDLNLYLKKSLKAVSNCNNATRVNHLNSDDKHFNSLQSLVYGSVPMITLLAAQERYQKLVDCTNDLEFIILTCANAYKLYCKIRPNASRDSFYRAKLLPINDIHPFLVMRDLLYSSINYFGNIPKHRLGKIQSYWDNDAKLKKETLNQKIRPIESKNIEYSNLEGYYPNLNIYSSILNKSKINKLVHRLELIKPKLSESKNIVCKNTIFVEKKILIYGVERKSRKTFFDDYHKISIKYQNNEQFV